MDNIWLLILYTFLMLIATSVIYFLAKEYGRIIKGNFNIARTLVSGLFVVVFIILNEVYVRDFLVPGFSVSITPILISLFILFINRNYFLIFLGAATLGYSLWYILNDTNLYSLIPLIEIVFITSIIFGLSLIKKILSQNYGIKLLIIFGVLVGVNLIVTTTTFLTTHSLLKVRDIFYLTSFYTSSFIFVAIIVYVIENLYFKFNINETFTVLDSISYYKLSLAKEKLTSIIKKSNLSFGILLLFDLRKHSYDGIAIEPLLVKLRKDINKIYPGAFFFKATTTYYSVFIPIKSEKDINLSNLLKNNKNTRICKGFFEEFEKILFKNSTKNYKIRTYGSIYGINSCNVDELIKQSEFLSVEKVTRRNNSYLIIFDNKRLYEAFKIKASVQSLSKYTTNFKLTFVKSIFNDQIHYPLIKFKEKTTTFSTAQKELTTQQFEVLMRFFAHQIMLKFEDWNQGKIIIPYLIKTVSSKNFNSHDFITKADIYADPKKIILGFKKDVLNKKFFLNIEKLKKSGVEIAVLHADKSTKKFIKELIPKYFMRGDLLNKKGTMSELKNAGRFEIELQSLEI